MDSFIHRFSSNRCPITIHAQRRATKRFMDTTELWSDVDTPPSLVKMWEIALIAIVAGEANNPDGKIDTSTNKSRQFIGSLHNNPRIGTQDPDLQNSTQIEHLQNETLVRHTLINQNETERNIKCTFLQSKDVQKSGVQEHPWNSTIKYSYL